MQIQDISSREKAQIQVAEKQHENGIPSVFHSCQMLPTVVLAKLHTPRNATLCQVLEVEF